MHFWRFSIYDDGRSFCGFTPDRADGDVVHLVEAGGVQVRDEKVAELLVR